MLLFSALNLGLTCEDDEKDNKNSEALREKVYTGSACKNTFLCLLFGDKWCVLSSCSDMNSGTIYT